MPPPRTGTRGSEGPGRPARVLLWPSESRVTVEAGTDLASAARRAGLPLGGVCGGAGTCGRCRVLVVEGRRRRPVLACQYRPEGSVTVEVPEETMAGAALILAEGVYVEVTPHPAVHPVVDGGRPFLSIGGCFHV